MNLELATTEDMLAELKRRQMHFVFIGEQNTNGPRGEVRGSNFQSEWHGITERKSRRNYLRDSRGTR